MIINTLPSLKNINNKRNIFLTESVTCPPITSSRLSVKCRHHTGNPRGLMPCNKPVPVGTVAEYECKEYYVPINNEEINNTKSVCQIDGTWSRKILKCIPGIF